MGNPPDTFIMSEERRRIGMKNEVKLFAISAGIPELVNEINRWCKSNDCEPLNIQFLGLDNNNDFTAIVVVCHNN